MPVSIPPWLNIGALDPVQFYAQGLQLGQRAAAERNQAAQLAAAAAERAANERHRQETAQLDALKFAQEVMNKRQENELKAREAALEYEGVAGFQRDLAAGIPPEQAVLRNPNMFRKNMGGMGTAYRGFAPKPQFQPEIIDVDGTKVLRTSPTSVRALPSDITGPISAEPIVTPDGTVLDYGVRGASGGVHVVRERQQDLNTYQRARLLQSQLNAAIRQRENLAYGKKSADLAKDPTVTALDEDIKKKAKQLGDILSGPPKKTETPQGGDGGQGSSGRVRVVSPNGQRGWIPAGQLGEAMSKGYTLAPEGAGASGSW